MHNFFSSKSNLLWTLMAGFFVANALVAEFMGVKLFSLEKTLGFMPVDWSLMGQSGLSFTLTAGVLLWPVVFVITDLMNEYFGPRGVRLVSYLTAGLIAYGFLMLYFAMGLEPADWWRTAHIKPSLLPEEAAALRTQVGDYNTAYSVVFGQSLWIIVGSLFAFLISQVVDVAIFHRIKARTGEGKLWLRATGSTLVSQFLDSFVVVFIALYIGQQLPFFMVLAISIMNYLYKGLIAFLMTPVIYWVHHVIDRYLGPDLAAEMKRVAQGAES
ncbi:MAG: queuosine precursor transporter [Saprospiraceae bacterium]